MLTTFGARKNLKYFVRTCRRLIQQDWWERIKTPNTYIPYEKWKRYQDRRQPSLTHAKNFWYSYIGELLWASRRSLWCQIFSVEKTPTCFLQCDQYLFLQTKVLYEIRFIKLIIRQYYRDESTESSGNTRHETFNRINLLSISKTKATSSTFQEFYPF